MVLNQYSDSAAWTIIIRHATSVLYGHPNQLCRMSYVQKLTASLRQLSSQRRSYTRSFRTGRREAVLSEMNVRVAPVMPVEVTVVICQRGIAACCALDSDNFGWPVYL